MSSQSEILQQAVEVLRRGEALTMDSVAREVGLTKPGVMHYFATKEALTVAVVDYIVDGWEADLRAREHGDGTTLGKLRSYVDYALTADFDASDLALLSDIRLRERLCARWVERLCARWVERLEPWLGWDIEATTSRRASLRAARLLADGAWMNSALGIATAYDDEREDLHAIALGLLNQGGTGQ